MAPPKTPRRADAPAVVGRELERARIDGFREDIADGPRMPILHGAQGVGRSTLWWYGVERSRAPASRCWSHARRRRRSRRTGGVDDLFRADPPRRTRRTILAHGRAVLETLRGLAGTPRWSRSTTCSGSTRLRRALRFALRRLDPERVGSSRPSAGRRPRPLVATRRAARRASDRPARRSRSAAPAVLAGPLEALRTHRAARAGTRSTRSSSPGPSPREPRGRGRLPLPESLQTAIGTASSVPRSSQPCSRPSGARARTAATSRRRSRAWTSTGCSRADGAELLVDEEGLQVRFAHPAIGSPSTSGCRPRAGGRCTPRSRPARRTTTPGCAISRSPRAGRIPRSPTRSTRRPTGRSRGARRHSPRSSRPARCS